MNRIDLLLLLTALLFQGCSNKTMKAGGSAKQQVVSRRAEVLFLGHSSKHHNSYKYAPWLASAVFKQGINITYTDNITDLNSQNLAKYDALVIYANHDTIAQSQEEALKNFVEKGKGLVALHSASFCFRNSDWYLNAVGGRFKTHGEDKFTARSTGVNHPVMEAVKEFETWDETYVHEKLNKDKIVLMERVEGSRREPYTWVRNQGKGKVFYTAFGHNDSTWRNPNFLKLVGNGILWSLPSSIRDAVNAFQTPQGVYTEAKIPNYEKRNPEPKFQLPFNPAESQKLMQVPADFKIELFAAEPDKRYQRRRQSRHSRSYYDRVGEQRYSCRTF
ncbi:MAG TPA: ThuA domain-containing protein [Pedobacter sp.]|jgi:type 1 glutamine amidotransferase